MAGSKHLANFADSIFAIGRSNRDEAIRYIKQLKARDTDVVFDSENVIPCQITKPHNFLGFEFTSFGSEREHLSIQGLGQTDEIGQMIGELKTNHPEISNYEIAKRLGINQMKVKRALDRGTQGQISSDSGTTNRY